MDQTKYTAGQIWPSDQQVAIPGSDNESLVGSRQERRKRSFSFPVALELAPLYSESSGVWCPEGTQRCPVGS